MLRRKLLSESLASLRLPCTCSRARLLPLKPSASARFASSSAISARIADLKYDLRRWSAKLKRLRREKEWESLILALLGANVLVWLAWKPAKALRLADQQWLDDFLRDNILLSWESLTSGRIWTLLTCSLANHSGLHLLVSCAALVPCLPLALDIASLRIVLSIYFASGALSSLVTAVWAHFYEQRHGKATLLTTTLEMDEETGRYVERYGPISTAQIERLSIYGSIPGRSVTYAEGGTAAMYGIVSFVLAAYSPKYAAGKLVPGYYLGTPFRLVFAAGILLDLFLARKRVDTSVASGSQLCGVVTGLGAYAVLRRMRMLK